MEPEDAALFWPATYFIGESAILLRLLTSQSSGGNSSDGWSQMCQVLWKSPRTGVPPRNLQS
jgi:hypothetical protein